MPCVLHANVLVETMVILKVTLVIEYRNWFVSGLAVDCKIQL